MSPLVLVEIPIIDQFKTKRNYKSLNKSAPWLDVKLNSPEVNKKVVINFIPMSRQENND